MEYKIYNIFKLEEYPQLIKDIKVARCMRSSTPPIKETEEEILKKLEDVSISEKLFCSFCNTSFEDQSEQRLHYKLDWHRYNLKQHLVGLKSVTEEKFVQLSEDLSSISGSESESEDSNDEGSEDNVENISSAAQLRAAQSKQNKVQDKKDDLSKASQKELLRLQASRHSKVFFENCNGKILSLYRCLLHTKKDVPEKDEDLVPCALDAVTKTKWAVIMLGGGHFAAAVFNGNEALLHKTFHSYTVRAHQGATQSSRDSRSGGSHPKSAGASLRRYNEASFMQHIQEILESWASDVTTCSFIFYRAVGHSKIVLFGGKNPPLNKSDPRLRTIPFATRRATFSEVKRVHSLLASIEVYGSADAFETSFPQSPKKRTSKFGDGNTLSPEQEQDSKNEPRKATDTENAAQSSPGNLPEAQGTSKVAENDSKPKKRSPKQNIDRAKPRKSPHRPLPRIVSDILAKSSSESDVSESPMCMVGANLEVSFGESLQQFDDSVPQHIKDKKRDSKKSKKNQQTKNDDKGLYRHAALLLRKKLWAACKLGDAALLVNSLQTIQPIEEENEQMNKEENSEALAGVNKDNIITRSELLKCLNEKVGENKETLLHVAASGGHTAIIRTLMEAGCDPNIKNKNSQTPYVVCANKETRNAFRRFVADFPEKYDYSKSQIAGPLTDDMEQALVAKRRDVRKAKRERAKEKKKEEEEKERERKKEEEAKARFLQLSDKEKRALVAAEKKATDEQKAKMVSRCFECALNITGKVPFEYDNNRFCSMDCLKEHKRKMKLVQPTVKQHVDKIYI